MDKKRSPISEAESSNEYLTTFDPINARISLYQSTFDNTGKSTNIGAELERIRAGAVRPLIELLRSCDSSQYDELKKKLPMACFQGLMEPKRGKENLTMPSGVLCVDFDGFNTDEAISVRDNFKTCQHILAAWLSPGHGVKALVRVNIADDSQCKAAFRNLEAYFIKEYGLTTDRQCKDISRTCYTSFDPALWINESAIPFRYETIVAAATRPTAIIIPIKSNPRLETYVLSAINSELENICNAPEGCGTSSLYRAAIRAGELSFTGLFCRSAVESHFIKAFLERKHSSNTLAHAEITFNNGWNLGENQPRQLPVEVMR